MLVRGAIFLLSIVIINYTQANDCAAIRMDKRNLQGEPEILSMENIPVQDQGSFGICFAYAASQAYDAMRKTWQQAYNKPVDNIITSPEMMALEYYTNYKSSTTKAVTYNDETNSCKFMFEGGWQNMAFDFLSQARSCPRAVFDDVFKYNNSSTLNRNVYTTLYQYIEEYRELQTGREGVMAEECQLVSMDKYQNCDKAFIMSELVKEMKNLLNINDKLLENELAKSNDSFTTLRNLLYKNCPYKNRVQWPTSAKSEYYIKRPPYQRKTIDHLLENITLNSKTAPLPIGVSLCSEVFTNKNYSGVTWDQDHYTTADDCGRHDVLIIGREMRKTVIDGQEVMKCHYLIRNSWGASCNGFDENSVECEDGTGQLWLNEDQLNDNLYVTHKYWF